MSDFPRQTRSRRKRNLLIAFVVVACLLVIFLLWVRSNSARSRVGVPAPASAILQTKAALDFATIDRADATRILLTKKPREGESNWKAILEKVTAQLSGKKTKVCGLSDLDAALFMAEQENIEGIPLNKSAMGREAANAALAEAAAKLARSDSIREQVLGLYLQASVAASAAYVASGAAQQNCKNNSACLKAVPPVSMHAIAAAAEPLVNLALATRDPNAYAAALLVCPSGIVAAGVGACASVSYAGWAAIEPDNAAAWFMAADVASTRNDVAGRDAALRRAMTAAGYDVRAPSLASVLDSDAVKAQSPFVRNVVGLTIYGLSFSGQQPWTLVRLCANKDVVIEDAQKPVCDKFANKLMEADKSAVGLSLAASIGKKIGWDAARVQAMLDEKEVNLGLAYDAMHDRDRFSCEAFARSDRWVRLALAKGERAIARDRVAASGKSLSALAEEYRKTYPYIGK